MLVHELVQPYLDNKANPNLDTSITRGWLPLILSARLSEKHFPFSNYPFFKSCVLCAYEKNSAGKYKKVKASNFCEKCNVYACKNCFEQHHTHIQPKKTKKKKIFEKKIYLQWNYIFLVLIWFSEFFFWYFTCFKVCSFYMGWTF